MPPPLRAIERPDTHVAGRHICTTVGEDDLDVVELITSLVSKSLLVAELAANEQRYYLLESTRQYAREKLVAPIG